jgi:hypothetical protein
METDTGLCCLASTGRLGMTQARITGGSRTRWPVCSDAARDTEQSDEEVVRVCNEA